MFLKCRVTTQKQSCSHVECVNCVDITWRFMDHVSFYFFYFFSPRHDGSTQLITCQHGRFCESFSNQLFLTKPLRFALTDPGSVPTVCVHCHCPCSVTDTGSRSAGKGGGSGWGLHWESRASDYRGLLVQPLTVCSVEGRRLHFKAFLLHWDSPLTVWAECVSSEGIVLKQWFPSIVEAPPLCPVYEQWRKC